MLVCGVQQGVTRGQRTLACAVRDRLVASDAHCAALGGGAVPGLAVGVAALAAPRRTRDGVAVIAATCTT